MSLPIGSVHWPDPEPKEAWRFEVAVRGAPAMRGLEAPSTAGSCSAASHSPPSARLATPAQASGKRSRAARAGRAGQAHLGAAAAT